MTAGSHPQHKLQNFAKQVGINPSRIIFTGPVDTRTLVHLYNGALALVFPSFHEGFGLPLLEAMATGCPIITSNRYSMPEIAGDAAIYVNPESSLEICDAMKRLLIDDELRRFLSVKGHKRSKYFSLPKMIKVYTDLYLETTSKGELARVSSTYCTPF